MAKIEHVKTGEILTSDSEIPHFQIYTVEDFDEDTGELIEEDRIELDGEEYRVLDDGVAMVSTD